MYYKFRLKKEKFESTWTLRPKIKVTLSHKEKTKDVIAILDTGSDLNYIPIELAEYFELLLSEETFTVQGAEQEFEYRTAKLFVKLEHPHKSYRKILSFMIPVKTIIIKEIILGTEFLKDFTVTFDYQNETIKLIEKQKIKK